jgi:hypothetical protein
MALDFKDIARRYFDAFSGKDLEALSGMFTEDVSLKDWEIEAKGKQSVIKANANIFDSVKTIKVVPLRIIVDSNIIAAELQITINNTTSIAVVDFITFDAKGLIKTIRAYKG